MKKSHLIIIAAVLFAAAFLFVSVKKQLPVNAKQNKRIMIQREERPDICDRSGVLLIGNRKRIHQNQRLRYAAVDGKFAAGLLGYTQFINGREAGQSGIEKLIDLRRSSGRPVRLTLDCNVQHNLEYVVSEIEKKWNPLHVYCATVNSSGELTGSAQRPVLDINNRKTVDGGMIFFPAEYIFSIPETWMKKLNSSGKFPLKEREKLNFHKKMNVFASEGAGKLSEYPEKMAPQFISDQTATIFHYLLAYIGVAEKKTTPRLVIFSKELQTPVTVAGKTSWLSVDVTNSPEKTLTALAEFPAADGSKNYTVFRCSWDKNSKADVQQAAAWLKKYQFNNTPQKEQSK